jgi:hypothetical protein
MKSASPWVYFNDDEVELRQIIIHCGSKRNQKKFTVSEGEKMGLVRVESEPHTLGGDRFSKAIVILKKDVRLCLSTKAL